MRNLLIITIVSIFSISIIFGIGALKKNRENGFERKIINPGIRLAYSVNQYGKQFSFIGEDVKGEHVLFCYDDLNTYRIVGSNLKSDSLSIPKEFNKTSRLIYATSFGNKTFLNNLDGECAIITDDSEQIISTPSLRYDQPQAISKNSVISRGFVYAKNMRFRVLRKLSFDSQTHISREFNLPIQIDGVFCNDGRLYYDSKLKKLYYMFFYKGELLSLDTNLNVVTRIKTVDTVRHANIKLNTVKTTVNGISAQQTLQTQLNNLVNTSMTTFGNKIYVCSKLKAGNEKTSKFSINIPIDVYSTDGTYLHSFYIPKFMNENISSFKINKDEITAITKNHIVIYKFKYEI